MKIKTVGLPPLKGSACGAGQLAAADSEMKLGLELD
jgi:hypothetical protein